jgi:hypothetical protein
MANRQSFSMRCNEEQFQNVRDKLTKKGVTIQSINPFIRDPYLYYNGYDNSVYNLTKDYIENNRIKCYKEWNENLFLKLCGIEVINPQVGDLVRLRFNENDNSTKGEYKIEYGIITRIFEDVVAVTWITNECHMYQNIKSDKLIPFEEEFLLLYSYQIKRRKDLFSRLLPLHFYSIILNVKDSYNMRVSIREIEGWYASSNFEDRQILRREFGNICCDIDIDKLKVGSKLILNKNNISIMNKHIDFSKEVYILCFSEDIHLTVEGNPMTEGRVEKSIIVLQDFKIASFPISQMKDMIVKVISY